MCVCEAVERDWESLCLFLQVYRNIFYNIHFLSFTLTPSLALSFARVTHVSTRRFGLFWYVTKLMFASWFNYTANATCSKAARKTLYDEIERGLSISTSQAHQMYMLHEEKFGMTNASILYLPNQWMNNKFQWIDYKREQKIGFRIKGVTSHLVGFC